MSKLLDISMIITQLQNLGLSTKEAAVYLALLETGPSPASTIARKTQIKRTSMYDLLNSLEEQNLIVSFRQGNYTYYGVDDVQRLQIREKEKLRAAEVLVRDLKEKQKNISGIHVSYYRGKEGYLGMYKDILKRMPKELLTWIDLDAFHNSVDAVLENEWTQDRIRKRIFIRLLMLDSPYARDFKAQDGDLFRETRLLPKDFPFKTTCILYENCINYFDPTDQMTGIRIQNPALYQMEKAIFEINWKSLH